MDKTERNLRRRLAAYLRGVHKLTETEIAIRLGQISVSTVSTLLREAKDMGQLEEQLVYKDERLTEEEEGVLHNLQFQSELWKNLKKRIKQSARDHTTPRIYLYKLDAVVGAGTDAEAKLRSFAALAAPEYRRLLTRPSVRTIGVAWGGALAILTEALRLDRTRAPRAQDPITVIATCGEPLDDRTTNQSSSVIAEEMSLALNGSRDYAKTLGITPAYLPPKTGGHDTDLIWRYIVSTKPYLEVFGPGRIPANARAGEAPASPPLCEAMDAFFTSISMENSTLGYGKSKLYREEFVDSEIDSVVYGDMGGIPLPRPNLTESQRRVLQSIEDCWTGLPRKQLMDCVSRGFVGRPGSRPPGCILTAIGERKARTVYQAVVVEGLVNHLFIDHECAEALEELLASPSAGKS